MSEKAASQKSQSPVRSPAKSTQKDDSIDGDNVDLDFEEISEDELDEESRIKGIGDALGVDWASLVQESRSKDKPTSSAKLRWEPHNILVNLGVSVNLAGEDLVKDILKQHADAEQNKEDTPDQSESANNSKEEESRTEHLEVSHPVAAIQVANRESQQIRKELFSSVGLHTRALSARRDLMIRRHLCNLPVNDSYVEAPKRHDPELFKIAAQLFERCL